MSSVYVNQAFQVQAKRAANTYRFFDRLPPSRLGEPILLLESVLEPTGGLEKESLASTTTLPPTS